MTTSTATGWAVYDLDTDKVIGIWKSFTDAEQFWADALDTLDTNWAVFPEVEVAPVEWYE